MDSPDAPTRAVAGCDLFDFHSSNRYRQTAATSHSGATLMHYPLTTALAIGLTILPLAGFTQSSLEIAFRHDDYTFSPQERAHIETIIRNTEAEVRTLLPDLPTGIRLSVSALARDVTSVGGVTGSADDPVSVSIQISTAFEGGITAASNSGLAPALYHEFHHLARGWTIEGNRFGPGIPIAAINEGLANVFSETHTNTAFEGNAPPENACQWWNEINSLPLDASYGDWMFKHPDGREAIGYRAGSYVIRLALANSGLSIVELSQRSIAEIQRLIGGCI